MSLYKKFYYKEKCGKLKHFEIDRRDEKDFKTSLLEASLSSDLGPIYMYDDDEQVWIKLDYYND